MPEAGENLDRSKGPDPYSQQLWDVCNGDPMAYVFAMRQMGVVEPPQPRNDNRGSDHANRRKAEGLG